MLNDNIIEQTRIIYGFGQFLSDMGGQWIGAMFLGAFFVRLSGNERLYQELGRKLYRKPEVYKYAYAKKIDSKDLLKGNITIE